MSQPPPGAPPAGPIPTPSSILGGFIVESFIALTLYGITIAQTYAYTLNCSDDPWQLKLTVGLVALLETLHSCFTIHLVYAYAVTDFGQLEDLANIVWSAGASIACAMLIVALVQGFYIRRIYILSKKSLLLALFVATLLLLRVSFGLATVGLSYTLDTWAVFRAEKGPLFTIIMGLSLSVAVDLTVAATLVYFLHNGRTGIRGTNNLIHSLMAYAVNTGLITMMCSIAILFTFIFLKSSFLFAGFVQMTSKLYANSLLGSLNARQLFRKRTTQPGPSDYSGGFPSKGSTTAPQRLEIFQETSKFTTTGGEHTMYPPHGSQTVVASGDESLKSAKFDESYP